MNTADKRDLEIAALRERLSRLGQASLRITEDLDLDAVLQRVVDGARLLTGASRGGLTVLDDKGQLEAFISSGLTEEAHRGFEELPGGLELFAYLSSLPGPLRVEDFSAHTGALGLPEIGPPLEPLGSFLSAPIQLESARVGNLYLSDKQDEEGFTREDEDTLVLFASQAALAIANARRHREERIARADLQTLIDTSPVGVVVFDALTGAPKSFNREARRIVDTLRDPDQTPEDLLDDLTFMRADGKEVSLKEFPMAQILRNADTVRAEEIVLRVADGRSVTALLNATPISGESGAVESVVVTMQDMTPIEEQERLRAEFLAAVSHELLAPLTSIKGSAGTLLGSATDMDPSLAHQFYRIIEDQADHMKELVADLLDVARIETGALPVSPEPAQLTLLVERARSAFSSSWGGNRLEVDVAPDLPLVMADRRRIVQVLVNLMTNAARHSPPGSAVRVAAAREDVHIAVSVSDEGRGIPEEQLPRLFRRFSGASPRNRAGTRAWASSSARGSWRRTGDASGPRATAWAWAHASHSPCPSPGRPWAPPNCWGRPARRSVGGGRRRNGCGCWRWTTTPTISGTCATPWRRRATAPVVTGDPQEALRLMEKERPQLVLLDLMLPVGDGVELMGDILDVADVPVIFISAYGREEFVTRAFDHGAVDYVVKPFSPSELAARIRSALRRRELSEPLEPYAYRDLAVDFDQPPGDPGGTPGAPGVPGVPAAGRACRQRRAGGDLRAGSAAAGVGQEGRRRRAAHPRHDDQAAPQAGRRRRQPNLRLHRAPRRLSDAKGGDAGAELG